MNYNSHVIVIIIIHVAIIDILAMPLISDFLTLNACCGAFQTS